MNAPLVTPVFAPGRGKKDQSRAEARANAALFREQLVNILESSGPLGARAIADMTGSKVNTVRDYMHKMINEGVVRAEKVLGKRSAGGGTVTAMYSLGNDESADAPKQQTRKKYPAHNVRDDLVAALFGAPQQTTKEMICPLATSPTTSPLTTR